MFLNKTNKQASNISTVNLSIDLTWIEAPKTFAERTKQHGENKSVRKGVGVFNALGIDTFSEEIQVIDEQGHGAQPWSGPTSV